MTHLVVGTAEEKNRCKNTNPKFASTFKKKKNGKHFGLTFKGIG